MKPTCQHRPLSHHIQLEFHRHYPLQHRQRCPLLPVLSRQEYPRGNLPVSQVQFPVGLRLANPAEYRLFNQVLVRRHHRLVNLQASHQVSRLPNHLHYRLVHRLVVHLENPQSHQQHNLLDVRHLAHQGLLLVSLQVSHLVNLHQSRPRSRLAHPPVSLQPNQLGNPLANRVCSHPESRQENHPVCRLHNRLGNRVFVRRRILRVSLQASPPASLLPNPLQSQVVSRQVNPQVNRPSCRHHSLLVNPLRNLPLNLQTNRLVSLQGSQAPNQVESLLGNLQVSRVESPQVHPQRVFMIIFHLMTAISVIFPLQPMPPLLL